MPAGVWWLASYPKSGNTWLRAFLWTLVFRKALNINELRSLGPFAGSRSQFDRALGIESETLSRDQEARLRPRVFETWAAEAARQLYCMAHDAYRLTPSGEPLFPTAATRGAVYVARDPRAVAVSIAHYMAQPIDEAIASMDNPARISGSSTKRGTNHLRQSLLRWSEHVESWLGAPFPVHLVRYEDFHADPVAAFGAVATFLSLASTTEAISTAIEAAAFSRLKAQERDRDFVERPHQAASFFREGRAEGWRYVLTAEQAARVVAAHGPTMRRLGYALETKPFPPPSGAPGAPFG